MRVRLPRHRDLAVPEDAHRDPRMYVERRQERAVRVPGAVESDPAGACAGGAVREPAVERGTGTERFGARHSPSPRT